jgi:hypothetical protein
MNIVKKIDALINEGPYVSRRYSRYEHMDSKAKGLNVENMEQKIIFCSEMDGQISDGMWENSRPWEHYKAFGIPKDNVKIDPSNLGLTATNAQRKYNFGSPTLLNIVGDRILLKVNLWKMFNKQVLDVNFPDDLQQFDRELKRTDDEYYKNKHAKIAQAGITRDMVEKAVHGPYQMKDLKKDCRRLSDIVQMHAGK